ncbi:MAG: DUF11 domain-containing protein, partial [Patulibacter sp.]|nr:DUF11 domain-containing protein [Patulibacter sp.]
TVGEAITWTATVGNGGPQTATGAVATLTIPSGMENVTAAVPGGTCTITGQTITCALADLPAGATAAITLKGTAGRDTAERSLTATGVVTGLLPDPITNNNTASAAVVTVPAAVDLVVTKTADKNDAAAGEQVTITTTVHNNGPSAATDVVLTDTIPDGVRLDSVVPSQGTCTVSGNQITCNLGTIPNGGTVTIAAVYTVEVTGSDQQLLNAGSATSPQFDSDGSNNAAQITATGRPAASTPARIQTGAPVIDVTKTVDRSSSVVGGQVVFTITARNDGTAPATGVRVVDQLPAGLRYVSTKVTGGTCTRNALTVTCIASTLAPGKAIVAKITTEVTIAGTPIDNVATATAAGLTDTGVKGQRASARVTGSGAPYVVAGIKSLEPYSRPGKRLRVAVKVTNVGQAEAKGVSACFTLPSNLVLTKKPAGLVQHGAQFCLTAPSLPAGRFKRVVLATRVTGGAGTTRPKLTGKATNSHVKVETYPIVIRGLRPVRAAGVTG